MRSPDAKVISWKATLFLAFQSIGVVYAGIGTSPLYVFASTFPNGIHNNDDILGVLSLIIYTILLSPMVKYVFVVVWANDNRNGGTVALYSLICRYTKLSLIQNRQGEDREESNYKLQRAQGMKEKMENSIVAKTVLFLITILGVSLVFGDW